MASLCHPWFTTTNFSYRFPIFETSATALCSTTGIGIYWEFMGFNGNPIIIYTNQDKYILRGRVSKKCHDQGWFLCCCPNMWNSLLSQWYTLWQSNMACWKICNLVPWFSHQRHPSIGDSQASHVWLPEGINQNSSHPYSMKILRMKIPMPAWYLHFTKGYYVPTNSLNLQRLFAASGAFPDVDLESPEPSKCFGLLFQGP